MAGTGTRKETAEERQERLMGEPGDGTNQVQAGGYFLGTDGTPHDAWGAPIGGAASADAPASVQDVDAELATLDARREALSQRRALLAAQASVPVEEDAEEDAEGEDAGDDDAPESGSARPRSRPRRRR